MNDRFISMYLMWQRDETYGDHVKKLERALLEIIAAHDVSPTALQRLAYILSQVPVDIFSESTITVAKEFLSQQNGDIKNFFRGEALRYLPGNNRHVDSLLSSEGYFLKA